MGGIICSILNIEECCCMKPKCSIKKDKQERDLSRELFNLQQTCNELKQQNRDLENKFVKEKELEKKEQEIKEKHEELDKEKKEFAQEKKEFNEKRQEFFQNQIDNIPCKSYVENLKYEDRNIIANKRIYIDYNYKGQELNKRVDTNIYPKPKPSHFLLDFIASNARNNQLPYYNNNYYN